MILNPIFHVLAHWQASPLFKTTSLSCFKSLLLFCFLNYSRNFGFTDNIMTAVLMKFLSKCTSNIVDTQYFTLQWAVNWDVRHPWNSHWQVNCVLFSTCWNPRLTGVDFTDMNSICHFVLYCKMVTFKMQLCQWTKWRVTCLQESSHP